MTPGLSVEGWVLLTRATEGCTTAVPLNPNCVRRAGGGRGDAAAGELSARADPSTLACAGGCAGAGASCGEVRAVADGALLAAGGTAASRGARLAAPAAGGLEDGALGARASGALASAACVSEVGPRRDEAAALDDDGASAAAELDGIGDSERMRRLLSQTGVKKPERRSKSPTLKLLDGLGDSMSRSSVVMLCSPVAQVVARHRPFACCSAASRANTRDFVAERRQRTSPREGRGGDNLGVSALLAQLPVGAPAAVGRSRSSTHVAWLCASLPIPGSPGTLAQPRVQIFSNSSSWPSAEQR
jgi:hypothetical protein